MSMKPLAALLLNCLIGLILSPRSLAQAVDVAVVVNPTSPAVNVSLADLRKMFVGEKRTWPGGIPSKLILRAPGSHEQLVLLRLVGMSESEYKRYWTAQVFRGEADAEPFTAPSLGMAKEATQAFAGAMSLVDTQDLKPGMKVIKVDGRLPGAPGYALH
jgi:hypothetical protein